MVALTDEQLANAVGWIDYRLNFIKNKIKEARENPATRAQARIEARDAFIEMMKIARTVAVRNGFSIPNTEFTDQELAQRGLRIG